MILSPSSECSLLTLNSAACVSNHPRPLVIAVLLPPSTRYLPSSTTPSLTLSLLRHSSFDLPLLLATLPRVSQSNPSCNPSQSSLFDLIRPILVLDLLDLFANQTSHPTLRYSTSLTAMNASAT